MNTKGDDTKERVIKAATKLFSLKGFKETSIREITTEADVNVSAINYYFESKNQLFREIIKGFGNRFIIPSQIIKSFKGGDDFKIRLEMFFSQMVEVGLEDVELVSLFFKEQDLIFREMTDLIDESFVVVRNTFIYFLKHGQKLNIVDEKINLEAAAKLFFHNLGEEVSDCPFHEHLGEPSIKDDTYREQWLEDTMYLYWKAIKA